MRKVCVSSSYCQYKTDTGYCGYTGCDCIKERLGNTCTVRIPDKPKYSITQSVDISDESIEKIADVVIKKLLDYIVIPGGIEKW